MAKKRVVIVGAGVLGLSCASELCDDPDLHVTVLDRRYPGSGSTGLSAGVYTRTYLNADDIELRVASVNRLMAHAEAGIVTLRRIGVLRLARDTTVATRYREAAEVQRSLGVEDATVLDPEELSRLLPDFDADGVVAARTARATATSTAPSCAPAWPSGCRRRASSWLCAAGSRGCGARAPAATSWSPRTATSRPT